ncbi:MAG TPA: DoxX family protein [Verrucomicrobiae bacterium]|jgi:uncharacterized membrane protein YphA (DoxX/SURF4 family)
MLQPPGVPKKELWTGYIMSGLPALLFIMSGIMKLAKPPGVVKGFEEYGFSEGLITPIGLIEILCTIVYLIPQTSVLGAILLTGYVGGIICTNLRIDKDVVMPAIVGILIWGGLFMRYRRIRGLIPFKQN